MALIIKETEDKKIHIAGTELQLPNVYARLEFVARANGLSLEIAVSTYTSKTTFEEEKPVFTDLPSGYINATIELTEEQSLETAHKYAKLAYEQLGYEVIIDLL
jgi:predicted ATPase